MGNLIKSSLSGQLYKFGLNAEDWQIEKDTSIENEYLLVNRTDPDFQMRGLVEFRSEESISWSELRLASY